MLSIRMKRLGRKGHPTYRVVVQDSRQAPTSGKYIALLGSYDPHTKKSSLIKDKAEFYLKHGAQPSDRIVSLFKTEKITLPKWVKQPVKKEKSLRNPEKLRKNRSEDTAEADKTEVAQEEAQPEADAVETAQAEESKPAEQEQDAEHPKSEDAKTEKSSDEPSDEDKS